MTGEKNKIKTVSFNLLSSIFYLCILFTNISCEVSQGVYPQRDITNVVIFAAGGGTDTCNRVVSAEMANALGINVNVVNRTGGVNGSLGMNYVYSRPADGYTLIGLSESCVAAGVQGGFQQRMNVWDFFIIGGSPDVISVTPNLPYQNLQELIEAAKADPKAVRAGASNSGSIHHLNLLAMEAGTGAELNYIPYPGSAPAQNAAMTGEVSVVITSIAEQAQLIRGGKLRPLAMLIPESFTLDEMEIPSAFDTYPELADHLPISQTIGFGVKKETPDDRKQVLRDAFKKALQSESIQNWAKKNYYVLSGKTGEEANQVFHHLESLFAWTLNDLGSVVVSPEELGIPKPDSM